MKPILRASAFPPDRIKVAVVALRFAKRKVNIERAKETHALALAHGKQKVGLQTTEDRLQLEGFSQKTIRSADEGNPGGIHPCSRSLHEPCDLHHKKRRLLLLTQAA